MRFLAVLMCMLTVSGTQLPPQSEYELNGHYIEKLRMTIPLPADAYVTGRTVSPGYEPLELFGISAPELEVELKKGNIYCTALWFPEENDMTEIIVTMTEDSKSEAIFQLRDYDDYYLNSLAQSYASYSEQGLSVNAMYSDAVVFRTDQAVYIKAHGVMLSDEAAENHLHYMSVVNGQRVEITLVEHYSVSEDGERPLAVSAANELMMDDIIRQISYDSIDNEFVSKNRAFLSGVAVVGVLSAGLVAAYYISKYRLKKALEARDAASGADKSGQV